jgi:hypothetical protein
LNILLLPVAVAVVRIIVPLQTEVLVVAVQVVI